jgi:flagellar hook-associated protein 3 FlgL
MRIANNTLYDNIKANLNRVSDEMIRANNIVSSGKRISNLSDDPVGLVNVLGLRASLENVDQMTRNIGMARTWLNAGESSLTQIEDILSELKSLAVQMSSSNTGSTERSIAAGTVDGLMRQVLALANTEVGGRYIFAGTDTDAVPFSLDDESDPTEVRYTGNGTAFATKIGKDITVAVGRDGESVFGDDSFDWSDPSVGHTNIFKTLLDFKSDLETNNVGGLQESLDRLDNHLETIQNTISDTGTKMIRLDVKEKILADLELSYSERKSGLEDADITEAVMDLKAREVAYQAALASSSRVMQMTLVDYL